jgi:DNA-binding MarR family transcriptional regulator
VETIRKLGLLALASRLKRLSDRLLQEAGQAYRQEGLGFEPRWFLVFHQLAEGPPRTVTGLAAAVGITHPAVIQAADEMEQAGLIASSRDAADKRKRRLALTPRGRRVAEALRPVWADIESATREVAGASGVDLLAAIDAMEAALDDTPLGERIQRRRGGPAGEPTMKQRNRN